MSADKIAELMEENARLREEIKTIRDRWERELIVAKANLLMVQEELAMTKEHLRVSMLRTIEADDEVFNVREDAVKAIQAATEK